MPPPRELNRSRRQLAEILQDRQMTAHEVARELGRPTGSIFGVLRRMHSDRLLEADSDPDPPTRGTQYRLSPQGAEALRLSLDDGDEIGELTEGQRLLVVERGERRRSPSKILAGSAAAGLIDWGAELPTGWLLALVDNPDPHRVHMLQAAFEKAGCRSQELVVDALVPGPLLRQRAAAVGAGGRAV